MTAEEKSKELYNKFYDTNSHQNSVKVREETAKQCTIIAVNEVLVALEYLDDDSTDFYREVLNHLNKL
jgi:hypothetical protein